MDNEIIKSEFITVTLTKEKIAELYKKVNGTRDWKINEDTQELMYEIVDLYLEELGHTFWDNPVDVVEYSLSKDKEITFVYTLLKPYKRN